MAEGLLKDLSQKRNLAGLGASLVQEGVSDVLGKGTGKAVGDYLRQEWWRKEADTFKSAVGAATQEKLNDSMDIYQRRTKLMTELPTEEGQDPASLRKGYYAEFDPASGEPIPDSFIDANDFMGVNNHLNTAASQMVGNLNTISTEYLDAASQFPNNPIIDASAKNMMGSITQSFEQQLNSIKMADAQASQRKAAEDAEKAQRENEIGQRTMASTIRNEASVADINEFRADDMRAESMAQQDYGRKIFALEGHDPETLDENEAIAVYRRRMLEVDMAAKEFQGKGSMLPPGINLNNVGDWLQYDTKGQGFLKSFIDEQVDKARQNPNVRHLLNAKTRELMNPDNPDEVTMTYSELPNVAPKIPTAANPLGITKEAVDNEVMADPQVYDVIKDKARDKAVLHLMKTNQIGGQLGITGGIPVQLEDGRRVELPVFEDAEEAQRIINPGVFTDENTKKYPIPVEEGFSGDPEDPYGPAVEVEDTSPVSETAIETEENKIQSYIEWLNEFGADPEIPKSVRTTQARDAVKGITKMLDNMAVRQSIFGQELPEDVYKQQTDFLLELRMRYKAMITRKAAGKEAIAVPQRTLADDVAGVTKTSAAFMKYMGEEWMEGAKSAAAGVTTVEQYLQIPQEVKDAATSKFLEGALNQETKGIFGAAPKEPVKTKGRLLIDKAIDVSVPYWMASDEEKKRRWQSFNKRAQ